MQANLNRKGKIVPGLAALISYTCVEAIMPAVSPTRRSGSTWYSAGVSPLKQDTFYILITLILLCTCAVSS